VALTRININLATFSYRNKGLEWGLIVLSCAVVLGLSAYLIHLALVYQKEILSYSNKIARIERAIAKDRRAGRKGATKLDKKELKLLESDVQFVQDLIVRDIFPWDTVLGAVERNMPRGIYLERLETDIGRRKLYLGGTAGSMENISVFLKNLDLNEMFKTSQLVKFSVGEGENPGREGSGLIHFDIECRLATEVIMKKFKTWMSGLAPAEGGSAKKE